MLLVPRDVFLVGKDVGRSWFFCLKKMKHWCVFGMCFVEHYMIWGGLILGQKMIYFWMGWSFSWQQCQSKKLVMVLCFIVWKKNICYNTEISRSYFSGLPPNISILHIFVGKIPCHCETQPPTALQQNVVQVTSSEFAHQCHSTNSHSQDVNGTSRKCSPLYLEKKKVWAVPEKNNALRWQIPSILS